MSKSYYDYIKTGQIDPMRAAEMQTGRERSRSLMAGHITAPGLPSEAMAFGSLDAIAVKFVEWYGPEDAAKVLRHYATVCERQKTKAEAAANG